MIHVHRYGGGPKIYIGLHGWAGSHLTFAPFASHVPSDASLYAIDLPGYGRSPRPRTWSADAVADEIQGAVEQLTADRVTLVGNCSGAILSVVAARLMRERVTRMVLIDPFAYAPWYFGVFTRPGYGRIAYRCTFANPVGRWITNASLRRVRTAETHLTESFAQINHEASLGYLQMLQAIDGLGQFSSLRMPVDIAYGERTFAAVKESIPMWLSIWPQATVFRLDGAGHLPIEEATSALARIVFRASA